MTKGIYKTLQGNLKPFTESSTDTLKTMTNFNRYQQGLIYFHWKIYVDDIMLYIHEISNALFPVHRIQKDEFRL